MICSNAMIRYPLSFQSLMAVSMFSAYCQETESHEPKAVFKTSRCGGVGVYPVRNIFSNQAPSAVRNIDPTLWSDRILSRSIEYFMGIRVGIE